MSTISLPFDKATSHPFAEFYFKFKTCCKFYGRFHITFISMLCLQVFSFLLFFSYFSQSLMAACGLAFFFLTLFSYFVLLFFFQVKQPQQLLAIRHEFVEYAAKQIPFEKGSYEYQLALSESLELFIEFLSQEEALFYRSTLSFKALSPLLEKFNTWLYWKNFQQIKELFFFLSIEELVILIKKAPTDLEGHAHLAQTYMKLAKLYIHPKILDPTSTRLWISPDYFGKSMHQKFHFYAGKAVEEFSILQEYSLKDLWIYAHLAEIYKLQEAPEKEIKQYESILETAPEDVEILFRLGVLYFELGANAKGLKIYERLLKQDLQKAESLISYYESFSFQKNT